MDGIQEREAKDLEVAKREVVHHTRVQEAAEQAALAAPGKGHTVAKAALEDL